MATAEGFPQGTPTVEGFPPGTKLITPKDVLWLNTFYITLPTNNILSLKRGEVLASDIVSFRNVHDIFMFEIVMCSNYQLATYIVRFRLVGQGEPERIDTGYFLMCNFSVVGFTDQPPQSLALMADQDCAVAFFSMVSALRRFKELQTVSYVFEVKIVIKMVEVEDLPGAARDEQEGALKELRDSLSEEVVQELAALLDRRGLVNVFTGRSNSSCAETKLNIIKRSATYSKKLLDYIEARKQGRAPYPEDFPNVINYLVTGEEGPLSEVDTLLAYLLGNTLWIPYLVTITRDHILARLDGEVSLLAEALQLSSHVEDKELFEPTAVKFLTRMQEVEECDTFKAIKEQTPHVARAIIHAVTVFVKTRGGWIPGWKQRPKPRTFSDL